LLNIATADLVCAETEVGRTIAAVVRGVALVLSWNFSWLLLEQLDFTCADRIQTEIFEKKAQAIYYV
jgi:phage terminase Nu1 subunit (DNA packaging protein)